MLCNNVAFDTGPLMMSCPITQSAKLASGPECRICQVQAGQQLSVGCVSLTVQL